MMAHGCYVHAMPGLVAAALRMISRVPSVPLGNTKAVLEMYYAQFVRLGFYQLVLVRLARVCHAPSVQ